MALPTVAISGHVVAPDGSAPVSGRLTVYLSAPGSALNGAEYVRVAAEAAVTITTGGVVAITLVPNASITPAGSYYVATFTATLASGSSVRWVENWGLATSPSTLDLGSVPLVNLAPGVGITPTGLSGVGSALTVTATGSTTARTLANRAADVVNVKDFGAVGNGIADDTAAIQAAVNAMATDGGHLYFPAGSYKVTTAISIPYGRNGGLITGQGDATKIVASGCAAFLMASQGYYRFTIEKLWLQGNSTAGIPAIDGSPSSVPNILGGAIFRHLRISGFVYGWKLKNAQLNVFEYCNCDMNTNGSVFYIRPDSGTGQQCNANRVIGLRVTGIDIATLDCVFPTSNERATNWLFENCDFQQQGSTVPPLTIKDGYCRVINCEFENYTGGALIELYCDSTLYYPAHFEIRGNILSGGGAASAGKIKITRAGSMWAQFGFIALNDAGSPSIPLCDCTARDVIFMANVGTINDTNPAYNIILGGTGCPGGVQTSSRFVAGRAIVGWGTSTTLDASLANEFVITPTANNAWTLNAPTSARTGQRITIQIRATLGYAIGALTWDAVFKVAAWTNPADGYSRAIDFIYNGTNWIEVSRTPADVPN